MGNWKSHAGKVIRLLNDMESCSRLVSCWIDSGKEVSALFCRFSCLRYGKPLIAGDKSPARLLSGNTISVTCDVPDTVETVTHHHVSTSGDMVRLQVFVQVYQPLVKNNQTNEIHSE